MEGIIAGVTVGIGWLVGLTAFFVRMHMRIKMLEEKHDECSKERKQKESSLELQLKLINDSMLVTKNNVKWIVKKLGGPEGEDE